MANVYECMFLLDAGKVAGDIGNAERELHTILDKHNAEILASNPWDERRLAYPINNQKKGLYYLTYFRTEGQNVAEIERDCRLSEMILRQMILKIDPKLVDTMLAVARGEMVIDEGQEDGPPTPATPASQTPQTSQESPAAETPPESGTSSTENAEATQPS